MPESKLTLLVEVAGVPHRPARAIILRFYEDGVDADVVNRKTGNELISYACAYEDGPKTKGLSRMDVYRVVAHVQDWVKIYDGWKSQPVRDFFYSLNPAPILEGVVKDVVSYFSRKIDLHNMDSVMRTIG